MLRHAAFTTNLLGSLFSHFSMEIEEKFRKLAPAVSSTDLLWLFYLSGEGRERLEVSELLDVLLHLLLRKNYSKGIWLEPPPREACVGEYPLGIVLYPDKPYWVFGIREEEWVKHILIAGMTGMGKTNLVFQILRELQLKEKPFLIFDWKRNYRDLLQLPEFSRLKVFTVGRGVSPFRFNPLLPPPGTEPGKWILRLVDVMKHAYFLGEGVEYLLREALDVVFENCGMYGQPERIPLFEDVFEYVRKRVYKGRMGLWQASTLRALGSLTYRHGLGPVVNVPDIIEPASFLSEPVVLELDALSDVDKVFLTEALLLWIYEYRKNEGKREEFKHALVIEEGHHVLSSWKERHEGQETILETALRQIREFGESVVVVDQEPSKLSESIKANTNCKIVFNLGNGKDILDVSTCLQLSKEEADCIGLLPVGKAMVSTKRVGCVSPMYVAMPLVRVAKGLVTDEDLKQRKDQSG